MSDLREKVAYLQGLAAGLDFDKSTKEGKMFSAIIDVFSEIVEEMEGLEDQQEELEEYIEAIDEDLGEVEEEIFGEDDYPDDDEDEANYVEAVCPKCHDVVTFDSGILSDEELVEVTCPNCGSVVYVNDEELDKEEEK